MGEEVYLLHPSKQTFYKTLVVVMSIFCLNTQYWDWYKMPSHKLYLLQRFLVLIFAPTCCVSQLIFLAVNFKAEDFYNHVVIITMVPVGTAVTFKVSTAQMQRYIKVIINFMREIHLYNLYSKEYPEEVHNYIKKMCINAEKNTRLIFVMIGFASAICYSAWIITPIIHNIKKVESFNNITSRLELTIYLWTPYFDYETNLYAYIWMLLLGAYIAAIAITVVLTFDTLNLGIVIHLTGHIKVFKYVLLNDQNKMLTDEEWTERLKTYTSTYYFITRSFKEVESAFGFNVATIYAQNLFQGGLLLYQLTTYGQSTAVVLTYGLMLPIFMGTLLILSVVLENVRVQAGDIPMLIYALPWESMNISNQKMFLSILFQVQPTLEFVAAFNIKTGLQPAVNIMKTIFSYYVMIKSSKEEMTS